MEPVTISITGVGLGRTTMYALITDGRLETVKLGRRHLIKTASIRRLIEGTE